jgi:hypothetical protein
VHTTEPLLWCSSTITDLADPTYQPSQGQPPASASSHKWPQLPDVRRFTVAIRSPRRSTHSITIAVTFVAQVCPALLGGLAPPTLGLTPSTSRVRSFDMLTDLIVTNYIALVVEIFFYGA